MNDIDKVKAEIHNIVSELIPDGSAEQISDNDDIFQSGLDSINAMSLVLGLQTAFSVRFEASEINIENFRTVDNIAGLLSNKLTM